MTTNGTDPVGRTLDRIYVTGDCDGLPDLRDALAAHPEVELVGSASQVAEAAAALTGGHLQVVLHATRAATLPVNELAAIREHTRAPLILLASNGSPALLEEALEHDVADVLLLPQLTDNVVFAIRKAGHVGKRLTSPEARHGRVDALEFLIDPSPSGLELPRALALGGTDFRIRGVRRESQILVACRGG